jgi:hypothetical protein
MQFQTNIILKSAFSITKNMCTFSTQNFQLLQTKITLIKL